MDVQAVSVQAILDDKNILFGLACGNLAIKGLLAESLVDFLIPAHLLHASLQLLSTLRSLVHLVQRIVLVCQVLGVLNVLRQDSSEDFLRVVYVRWEIHLL